MLVGVFVAASASTAATAGATPVVDPLGCAAAVFDPTGVTTAALTAAVAADAAALHAAIAVAANTTAAAIAARLRRRRMINGR